MINNAAHLCVLQLNSVTSHEETSDGQQCSEISTTGNIDNSELLKLKEKYAIVFEDPKELPPCRGNLDHKFL